MTLLAATLQSNFPGSVRELAVSISELFHRNSWGNLDHSIGPRETAFGLAHDMPFFDDLIRHPEDTAIFDAWMATPKARADCFPKWQ